MKKLSHIIEEKNKINTWTATITPMIEYTFESNDITNAGKIAEQEMDEIDQILQDRGYHVMNIELSNLDQWEEDNTKQIKESVDNVVDKKEVDSEDILNDYDMNVLVDDVIDIFDIVEKHASKSKNKKQLISMLIEKLNETNSDNIVEEDVLFKKFEDGEVIALFVNDKQTDHTILSYMHIGQHGEASMDLIDELEDAQEEEYIELYDELIRIGYDLTVLNK